MISAIVKGCYPYFSILAFCVIVWRIKAGLWNRRETIVLVCVIGHLLLEILQLIIGDGKWEISRRYLLPATPLLFGWTAYGLRVLYLQYRSRIPAWCLWSAGCLALAVLLFDGMAPSLKNYYSKRKRGELEVIAQAVPAIRANYVGPATDQVPAHRQIYHSHRRPVVWSEFPAVAFFAGGRSEPSPFCDTPDFWILRPNEPEPPARKLLEMNANGFCYILYQAVGTHRNPPEYEHDLRRNLSTLSAGI